MVVDFGNNRTKIQLPFSEVSDSKWSKGSMDISQ